MGCWIDTEEGMVEACQESARRALERSREDDEPPMIEPPDAHLEAQYEERYEEWTDNGGEG